MRTLTMPFPIFKRGGIVGVRIAIVTEMRAGIKIYFLKYTSPFIYRSEMHFRVQKMGKLQALFTQCESIRLVPVRNLPEWLS